MIVQECQAEEKIWRDWRNDKITQIEQEYNQRIDSIET
jgi:uncharacterized lipoprotein YddW (UPF0748 family)